MARLLRLHLASVGHPDARFSPLSLDFRGPGGAAVDTVLWLRNGGGKSSLLNLFYSTFVPQTKHFLGKRSDGRSRQLGDYVQSRDLACVVSEWEMASSPSQPSDIRIIGQVICWKDAVQAAHDESRLERCFFTFRSGVGIGFESVPLFGLSASPSLSLDQFRNWLGWLKGEHRALEPESRSQGQKGDWQRVLRDVGFDEELFQYQLIMNGREGGADELFRVRNADEFIKLFLEIAYPPRLADETARTLTGVREKLMRLPQHSLEERFALELIGAILPLEGAVRAQEKASAALAARRRENFLLHAAIGQSLEKLKVLRNVVREEIASIDFEAGECKQRKLQLQEYRLNYEYLANELAFTEAEQEQRDAMREQENSEDSLLLAVAAEFLESLRQQEEHLAGLRRTQAALQVEQRPALDELGRAGAVYAAALNLLQVSAAEDLAGAQSKQAGVEEEKRVVEVDLNRAVAERGGAEAEFSAVEERLRRRDQQRAILRNEDWVEDREKASAASTRWEAEMLRCDELARQHERHAVEADRQAVDARSAGESAIENRRHLERQAADLKADLDRGRTEETALRENIHLREAASSDTPDLEFPPLVELVWQKEKVCLNRIIATRMDAMEDERAAKYQESEHLLPPSLDVDRALFWLKAQNVLTAMPAYRFLSQNERDAAAATERIRQDPARYSGIMVNSRDEFRNLHGRSLVIPGLRNPVAIALTGFAPDDFSMSDTLVLIPESSGAFNQAAASEAQDAIQRRLEKAEQKIRALEEERQATAAVLKRLSDFRAEFGGGVLARLEVEHLQKDEAARQAKHQAEQSREEAAMWQAEAERLRSDAISIHKSLPALAAGVQKLKAYVSEFERHEENWTERRGDLLQSLEGLSHQIDGLEHQKAGLEAGFKVAVETVAACRGRLAELEKERAAIQHFSDIGPVEVYSIGSARSRYTSLLAAFESRYGNDALSGQIHEAEIVRGRLEASYVQRRGSLDQGDVSRFLEIGDLTERKSQAERRRMQAHVRVTSAGVALDKARAARKARAHKQGQGLPPGAARPETSSDARAKEAELTASIDQANASLEEIQGRLGIKKDEAGRINTDIAAGEPLLGLLEGHIEEGGGIMPSLPDEREAVQKLAHEAKKAAERLGMEHQQTSGEVDRLVEILLAIPRREDFAKLPSASRDKLPSLPKAELLARCGELKAGYEERQKVLRAEIASFNEDKDIVVHQLHNVAREAISLLSQAERASVMPESMSGWASQPFLRIKTPPTPEPVVCRERLGMLVDRMVQEKAIPDGHELAFAAAREIATPFKVTLLKPELVLSPHRHDIVEFGNFSDGERLTAAILLYASLAQLRRRSREGDRRSHEAGILILDNPFGKASLRDFVEIQMRVASQMGVQLVYATGINDLGALEVFPRIIRLRNTHRDRRSGDKVVTQDSESGRSAIEAAAANLKP
ncbi:hypothetical protein [Luteolibacter sp. Populi]|uniref:hypothetical protein n=1 Tax=Luteolibacter sp. Populi TaxID=3230487 RepID=UPI00346605E8